MANDDIDKPSIHHQLWIVLRILAPVLWAGMILWLSLTPTPPQVPEAIDWDKLLHAGAYGLLTLLLVQMVPCVFRLAQGTTWLISGLVAVGYGGLMEILQWLTRNGRTADWKDLAADAVGALICYVIFRHMGVASWLNTAHHRDGHG